MDKNMLSIPTPSIPNISTAYTAALRQSIISHAGETHHPDTFASDIAALVDLRSQLSSMETHQATLSTAYTYYAQLVFVTTKLPSSFPLAFPWSQPMVSTSLLSLSGSTAAKSFVDSNSATTASLWEKSEPFGIVYHGTAYVAHPLLPWERSNVLFAIAALLSQFGVQEPRNDGNSIKRAVAYFQTASAIFTHLETQLLPSLQPQLTLTSPSHNLSPSSIQPLAALNLAQAQECFWQKAASDGMKSGTVAKLAKAVEDLYEQTAQQVTRAEQDTGPETVLPRTWVNHINTKRYHFAAASQYRKSQEDLSNSRYGDEIARLQVAESHVKNALSALKKGLPSSTSTQAVTNDLKGLQSVIDTNLKRARKDNDLIYLEPITPAASLPAISGAQMVQPKLPVQVAKPIECLHAGKSVPELPALGKPLFGALVPYGAHLAISVYEDRKETWWREAMENKRQELEAVVRSTLDSLNLPASIDALDRRSGGRGTGPDTIPPALLSQAEQIRSQGGTEALQRLRSEVERMSALNASTLETARESLQVEADEDSAVRAHYSAQSQHWSSRPESSIAAQGHWRRYEELAATVKMAEQSDAVVRGKVDKWSHAWNILQGGKEAIVQQLPGTDGDGPSADTSSSSSSTLDSSSPIVQQVRTTLESIDDVLSEYAALSSEAKAVVRSDDIREKVMREVARLTTSGTSDVWGAEMDIGAESFEDLFQAEFGKYKTIEGQVVKFEGSVGSLLDRLQVSQSVASDHET